VEQWQRGTVAADFHHVLDQILDGLVFAQFSLEAFAERVNYALSQRLAPVRWARARASRSASGMPRGMMHLSPQFSS